MVSRSVYSAVVAFALFAVVAAHFEDDGVVPATGSTTAKGDPAANEGETGPKPGSPAAEAAAAAAATGVGIPGATAGASGTNTTTAPSDGEEDGEGSRDVGAGDGTETEGTDGVAVATPVPGDADPAAAAVTTDNEDDKAVATSDPEASPEGTPEGSPDADARADASATDEDDGSVCFPVDATVELEDGSVVPMAELSVGDIIKVGANQFSKVFMFTHKMPDVSHRFVTLETASGASIALTKGHYIYADGSLVAAGNVNLGATVILGSGATDVVVAVSSKIANGLYNPQTVHGNVVVNGIVSSTYTTAVEPSLAHAILAPFRFFNKFGVFFSGLESGSDRLANIAPTGATTIF